VVALVEYCQTRVSGHVVPRSTLFVYQMALKLLRSTEDIGTELRTTIKALKLFGAPSRTFWPYGETHFQRDPVDAFLYLLGRDFDTLNYLRLDGPKFSGRKVLRHVRSFLAAGFPSTLGFPVPTSLTRSGNIPYRPRHDAVEGGQAALAVGYDDRHRIGSDTGALLIRNSWGSEWGEDGYGWLPYAYITNRFAVDFWTMFETTWLESDELLVTGP